MMTFRRLSYIKGRYAIYFELSYEALFTLPTFSIDFVKFHL